jgi:hypothetical protein
MSYPISILDFGRRRVDMSEKKRARQVDTDELAAVFDPRLAEVWTSVFTSEIDIEQVIAPLACFLRMAYLRGYQDALDEPERGTLFRDLGLEPTPAQAKATSRNRRKGGSR